MNKKLNKKLLNLIALCSGITATVAVGIGGIVYSIQEKNSGGGDEPVDKKVLPEEVYEIEGVTNTLKGFTQAFLNNPDVYSEYDTMQIPARVTSINESAFYNGSESTIPDFIENLTFAEGSKCSSIGIRSFESSTLNHIDFSNAINLSLIRGHAFENCSSLTSVDLSKCTILSSMEFYAFYGCTSLISVNFSDNLTKIPSEAFGNCSKLTSIDLSNCTNLTLIDHSGFDTCKSLTSVKLPESLEKIEYYGFRGCSSLSSIDFSNVTSLSSIGNCAFEKCLSLTSISLPSNLSTLGMNVFAGCSSLNSITWDSWKGNTTLYDTSFSGVYSDRGAVTVANQSDDAHDSIALLEYLLNNGGLPESWLPDAELPDSVYRIENDVLMGFTSEFLANSRAYRLCNTMQIPARVTSINESAFIDDPTAEQPNSTIPSFITKLTFAEGSNCSTIGSYAFVLSPFTSATLPDGLTTLNYASFGFSKLTSITLPNNLIAMGPSTFNSCSRLTSITLPNNLNTISSGTFMNCSALESVVFPNNLSLIETDAFDNCPLLSEVDLLNSTNLTSIGEYAFNHCSSLTSVSFPKSLSVVESSAFNNCSNLSSITWDAWNGNTTLQSSSFAGVCPDGGTVTVTNPIDDAHDSIDLLNYLLKNGGLPETWKLEDRALPEEVFEIDGDMIRGFKNEFLNDPTSPIYKDNYKNCNTIEIPAGIRSAPCFVGSDVPKFITKLTFAEGSIFNTTNSFTFAGWKSLISADFSNATSFVVEFGTYFFKNDSSLTSIILPPGLNTISGNAFDSCTSLTTIDLSNISSINSAAFKNCTSLTTITLPSKLTSISKNAFYGCSNLKTIIWDSWKGEDISLNAESFVNIASSGTIIVTNPIDDAHNSQALLDYLKANAGLPEGWHI